MAEELKSLKDHLIKTILSSTTSFDTKSNSAIKELVSALASIAGKGKDEIVQIISREIGIAVGGVVKEPLRQVLEESKLKISIELEPKTTGLKKKKKTSKKR